MDRSLSLWAVGLVFLGCGGTVDTGAFGDDGGGGADTGSTGGDVSSDTGGGGDSSTGDSTTGDSTPGDSAVGDTGTGTDSSTDPDTGISPTDSAVAIDTGTKPDVATVSCGDAYGKPYNGHCYIVLKQRTFTENTSVCASLGGYLAAITSDGEQYFVQALYPSADVWLGLTHPDGAKFDKWTSGEAIGFTRWASGEPNGSGNCGRMYGGGPSAGHWGDTSCSNSLNAICERPYL